MTRRLWRVPRHSSRLHEIVTPATVEDAGAGKETPTVAEADQAPEDGAQQGATGVPIRRRWCAGSASARATTAPPVQRHPRKNSRSGMSFTRRSSLTRRRLANQRRTRGYWPRPGERGEVGGKLAGRANALQFSPASLIPCSKLTSRSADGDVLQQTTTDFVGVGSSDSASQTSDQTHSAGRDCDTSWMRSSLRQSGEILDQPPHRASGRSRSKGSRWRGLARGRGGSRHRSAVRRRKVPNARPCGPFARLGIAAGDGLVVHV